MANYHVVNPPEGGRSNRYSIPRDEARDLSGVLLGNANQWVSNGATYETRKKARDACQLRKSVIKGYDLLPEGWKIFTRTWQDGNTAHWAMLATRQDTP